MTNIEKAPLNSSWKPFFKEESKKVYFKQLSTFLDNEISSNKTIYPEVKNWFHAYNSIEPKNIKVLIVGQDPYHGTDKNNNIQGHGLAFSVRDGVVLPPSLKNIYKELNVPCPESGNLEYLAEQGVFLLNTALTVEEGKPGSHSKKGWSEFTANTLQYINEHSENNMICLAWGKHAQKIINENIDGKTHFIINTSHPSPLGATKSGEGFVAFLGSGCFKRTNEILKKLGSSTIDWVKKDKNKEAKK